MGVVQLLEDEVTGETPGFDDRSDGGNTEGEGEPVEVICGILEEGEAADEVTGTASDKQ